MVVFIDYLTKWPEASAMDTRPEGGNYCQAIHGPHNLPTWYTRRASIG